MEDPLWVAMILLVVAVFTVSINMYRNRLASQAKEIARGWAEKMKMEFRGQLHDIDNVLYRSLCVRGEADKAGEKTTWLRIEKYRPWLIIEAPPTVDKDEVLGIAEHFGQIFQEKQAGRLLFVRTSVLDSAIVAHGEVSS